MEQKHRDNLKKLADYLITGETAVKFDMSSYYFTIDSEGNYAGDLYYIDEYECGTAACAIGHGPAAGIEISDNLDWDDYTKAEFGIHVSSAEHEWLFDSTWADIDNTPQGAAKRIYWFLEHGVPEDYHHQIYGDASLCYKD